MKILVFGNMSVGIDSAAPRLMAVLSQKFPDIEFLEFDAVEELDEEGESLTILDAVVGIEEVTVFDGIESFAESPRVSLHDFDLPVYLRLLMKLGKVKKVKIIGIPAKEKDDCRLLRGLVAAIRKIQDEEK